MEGDRSATRPIPPARWLHRLAVLAVCLAWPLIWIGGLVTTYDAGMAVPDWPGTYGYNLFLYPYKTWIFGPFDLFIEHGHRLLGAVVGVVTIAMCIAAWIAEPRRWTRLLVTGALLAVIGQGVLGGLRVVLSDRTLAMIHGCGGPAVLALFVVTAVVTSRFWWQGDDREPARGNAAARMGRGSAWLMVALVAVSYLQILLGAQIRHTQPDWRPERFAMFVIVHIATAFCLWFLSGIAWMRIRRCGDVTLSRPGLTVAGLVAIQIVLGAGTWVVSYGWPWFFDGMPGAAGFLIQAQGFVESIIVTAHVATGALILAVSTLLSIRTLRIRRSM